MLRCEGERRRLDTGPVADEAIDDMFPITLVVTCRGDADRVLERVREVLTVVVDHQAGAWPALAEWQRLLPWWFVKASDDAPGEEVWSVDDWLFWLRPEERYWCWWDGTVEARDRLRVAVLVEDVPPPLGALEWLLQAAGAVDTTLG